MRTRFAVTTLFMTVLSVGLLSSIARADDASRISYLESEIQKLRTQVGEQARRIQRLEVELDRLGGGSAPVSNPKRITKPVQDGASNSAGPQPWHAAAAWKRVSAGMTQEQVVAILGQPTAVEAVDAYKTLFYRGSVAGVGELAAHVNLKEGKVVAVKPPVF